MATRKPSYQPSSNPTGKKYPTASSGRARKITKKNSLARYIRWLGLALALGGVAMISAMAGALLAFSLNSTPLMQHKLSAKDEAIFGQDNISSQGAFRLPQLTRQVNILVLGIKVLSTDISNPPPEVRNLGYHALVNSFEGLSDTMMLIRFNPETKQLVVLSIPRDTRTEIPGYGIEKINAANARGGPGLTARSVSELLGGVQIDRYIRINVQGVEKLVDALGGVTVYVPQDMKYQDDSQHLYINLKAGKRHLNGNQALQLLRFRYDENGDIGRIQRQQMVIRALTEQALNPATLARLPKILPVIQSHIDTNLSVEELVALVGFGVQTSRANTQMLMLPGDFSAPGEYNASYWLPDARRIDQMVSKYFNLGYNTQLASDASQLQISIQDSTGQPEAAYSLARRLRILGYTNVSVDRPWREPIAKTRIIAQGGDLEGAKAIRDSLGFGEVRVESTGYLRSDITIQLAQDWLKQQP